MLKVSRSPLIFAALLLQSCAGHTVSVWNENESWAYGPVGITNYSNGLNVTWSPTKPHEPCKTGCSGQTIKRLVDFANILATNDAAADEETWLRYGIAQQFFTPNDITISTLQPDDRPYAGYLYASLDIVNEKTKAGSNGRNKYFRNTVGLRAGVVGPSSLGGDLQKLWHRVCACKDPEGWHLQLEDEPGFVYSLGHQRHLAQANLTQHLSYDVIGTAQAAIGNIYSGVDVSGIVRLGWDMDAHWSANSMADVGYDHLRVAGKPEFFLFAGAAGRYVARDIFVDGNTFRNSHSVSRTPFVLDQIAGFGIHWKRLEFRAILTHRSKQYRTQAAPTRFGAVVLTWSR